MKPLKYFLLLLFLLLWIESGYSQDSKPDAALNTVAGAIGISDVDSQILLSEVRSQLGEHYRLSSWVMFNQVYERW